MRKDVKLGFTIGGILLAVLIVYVLVVPEREVSDVRLVDASGRPILAQPMTPQSSGAIETAPAALADSSIDASAPDASVSEPTDAARGEAVSATPAAPTDSASTANASDVDWDTLLGGGEVLMTRTPAVPGPRSEVAVAPEGDAASSASEVQTQPVIDSAALVVADAVPQSPTTRPMSAGAARTHVIRSGETLSSISKSAYGSPNFYPHILQANPGLDANRLKVGATITLPPIDQVAPAGVSDPASPIDAASEYRVASGDSLYSISMRLYGSADRMGEMYELNKQAIGADPSKLKLNMVLKLPVAPTRTAAR